MVSRSAPWPDDATAGLDYSPYVALFFAFHKDDSKEEAANPYRAVYVLNKSFLTAHEDETGIRLWEPRH